MNDMRKRFFGVAATSLFTMVLLPLIVLGLAVGAVNNHVLRREIDQSNARQIRFVSERVSGVTGDLEKLNQSLISWNRWSCTCPTAASVIGMSRKR